MAMQTETPIACVVTRLPGAPPRRAGRVWAVGETIAEGLTAEQMQQIAADPRYRIDALPEPDPEPDPEPEPVKPSRKPRQPKA